MAALSLTPDLDDKDTKQAHACQVCGMDCSIKGGWECAVRLADQIKVEATSEKIIWKDIWTHVDRNARTFRCAECPRGFNRRDLLLRHQAVHEKNRKEGGKGLERATERAVKACDACVKSKLKCDDARPCRRCQKRGIACSSESLGRIGITTSPSENSPSTASATCEAVAEVRGDPATRTVINDFQDQSYAPPQANPNHMLPTDLPMTNQDDWDAAFNSAFPSFFESIMVPNQSWVGGDQVMVPPELSAMIPEQDDWLGSDSIFDIDFSLAIDRAMEPLPAVEVLQSTGVNADTNEPYRTMKPNESARQRHSIFLQDSPWLWNPNRGSNAFSEHNRIQVDEQNINLTASPHTPHAPSASIPDDLSFQSRDRIFQLVIKTSSKISVPTFPSVECLELLLKVGITKRLETDAWIHPYTFCSDNTRTELLIALIAAGCVCFGVPSISRTGLVLLEIARVALAAASEEDNSSIRDLQYLQASMIWLDVCGFCGYKRKMETAESNLQPVVTALRRFGKLDKVAYEDIVPSASDTPEVTDTLWRRWVQQESFKRLVYHLFEHDVLMTIARHRPPITSYAELTCELPASRDLWLAPTAESWRTLYLDKLATLTSSRKSVSLRSLLCANDMVQYLPQTIDGGLAASSFLYGVAAQIWEYNQQAAVVKEQCSIGDPSSTLWLQARQHSLSQKLKDLEPTLISLPATSRLIHAFLMMTLNVDIDTVMRFAGKCGELEAHRAYHELQSWVREKSARVAVWHAAQAVRAAKAVPPYQLRGADSFVTYHAIMVLWSYGMLVRDSARRTGSNTPAMGQKRASPPGLLRVNSPKQVILDDAADPSTDVFVHTGEGRPCIRFPDGRTCELRNPSLVLAVGSAILQANCPTETRDGMPQLIKSLCTLMEELGSLR